jgi:hypothetical protein
MANEVETIGNAYSSNSYGQSTLKTTIDNSTLILNDNYVFKVVNG